MTQVIPQTPPDYDRARIIERPDGFYWAEKDGGREYGPFGTLAEAVLDMEAGGSEQEIAPEESLEEAEKEIGISEYIDPDTGVPAEDGVPRLEDH